MKTVGKVHTLTILNATEEDIADYACAAENVKTATALELKGGDVRLEVASESVHSEEVVTKGQDVTLTVPLVKGALQTPQVQWMFQGQAIKESERVSKGELNESGR
jgi:hypothetical protein